MNHFKALVDWLKQAVTDQEHFQLGYADEASEFVRFNHAQVRQAGQVQQASLNLLGDFQKFDADHYNLLIIKVCTERAPRARRNSANPWS